ncbi:hypothetical protein CASFOL_024245 [Castilleja foliolosa]|uniref:Uncharacterized protein n=1 Tax=Castilleja foliolosa TaxID=1961234 RepID=A0ABD3CPI9_9LAMI
MEGIEEMVNFVLEKLKQVLLAFQNVFFWFNNVSLPDSWRDNISHWLTAVSNSGRDALAWLDRVFPPGTRVQKIKLWLNLALPYLIAAVVLAVAIWVCLNLCAFVLRWVIDAVRWTARTIWASARWVAKLIRAAGRWIARMMRSAGRFLCARARRGVSGAVRGTVKMMKAPGRNMRIPRSSFEIDPKGYFLKLRASPGDNLC